MSEQRLLMSKQNDPWTNLCVEQKKDKLILNFKVLIKVLNLKRKKKTRLSFSFVPELKEQLDSIFAKATGRRQLVLDPTISIPINYPIDDYILSCSELKKTGTGYVPIWTLEFPKELFTN